MSRILQQRNFVKNCYKTSAKSYSVADKVPKKSIQLPQHADVVIIGNAIVFIDIFENSSEVVYLKLMSIYQINKI